MKLQKKISLTLVCLCISALAFSQNIVVDDSFSAQQLVQNYLLNNTSCATSGNETVSGDNFSNGAQSYGAFTYSGTDFPFTSGIVLSTSRASRTAGPNDNLIDEGSPAWLGDTDLENALGLQGTVNATSLEFDFTPLTSQISFDYIFASEEYHGTAQCIYSDGFAFLLKPVGSSGPYQNLALVPNTTIPVSVTNVHPLVPGGCDAENETYFGSYNGPIHPINFDGQTVVMTAKANVIPGTTYHIKLVIADEKNYRYDSAIFLGGGSFNIGTDLGDDRLIATANPICQGETYTLTTNEIGTNAYKWFKNNVEIPGEITSSYVVQDAGIYRVEITLGTTACVASGEVTIEYAALPILQNLVTLVQCDDNTDGISTFNLTKLDTIIKQGDTQLGNVSYYLNQTDAENEQNVITNPTTFSNAISNQLIARVPNAFGCVNYAVVNLDIANNTLPNQNPLAICDEDGTFDGKTTIDLSQEVSPQVSAGLPAGMVIEYYSSMSNAVLQSNQIPNNFTNTTANSQIIYARIVNGPDCYGIIPVTIAIITFNPANFQDENVYLCTTVSETLSVATGFSSYTWSTGATSPSIVVSTAGIYSVTVTNSNGCEAIKTFNVVASSAPIITSVTVNDFSGNNNSIIVNVSGTGNYEYSIDGIHFQDAPVFTNVAIGQYIVTVHDKNGCGPNDTEQVTVLDYPRFFSPNGDGNNDRWVIRNLSPKASVIIFDRYGKALYGFRGNQSGWNGKVENIEQLSDDYWFVITLENNRIIKGHFALKR